MGEISDAIDETIPPLESKESGSGRDLSDTNDVDARTDVYAFGIVLFEMLTATMPYDGEGAIDIMLEHLEKPIPRLSDFVDVPVMPEWIVVSCLAKDAEERFASATELEREIENAARLYHHSL